MTSSLHSLLERAKNGQLSRAEIQQMSMEEYAAVRGVLLKSVESTQQQWDAEMPGGEVERTCPWCGLLCESVAALAEHEEECE